MKKALLFLLAVSLLAVSLTACSGGGAAPSTTVNMEQLQKAMLAADPTLAKDITSITSNTGDASEAKKNFSYFSTLDYEKVDRYLLSYSSSGTADEIAVIAVKDAADVGEAASTLRAHVDDRLKLFRQYGPDQASRVEKAEIFTKDQYAVLLICDDSGAVKTAFETFLSSGN